jgi:hypothetical protein
MRPYSLVRKGSSSLLLDPPAGSYWISLWGIHSLRLSFGIPFWSTLCLKKRPSSISLSSFLTPFHFLKNGEKKHCYLLPPISYSFYHLTIQPLPHPLSSPCHPISSSSSSSSSFNLQLHSLSLITSTRLYISNQSSAPNQAVNLGCSTSHQNRWRSEHPRMRHGNFDPRCFRSK